MPKRKADQPPKPPTRGKRARAASKPVVILSVDSITARHDDGKLAAQREWPLFGTGGSPPGEVATDRQEMILRLLAERTTRRDGGHQLEHRLDEASLTLKWWNSVGCEVCFVTRGQPQVRHTIRTCNQSPGCDKARSILCWLDSLDIPRFSDFTGACSMCTNSWHPCQDICVANGTATMTPRLRQEFWQKELAKGGRDGRCERKPAMRRVIAALCACDDQFGNLLARYAWETDNIDISSEEAAREWFERKVPFPSKDSWIPKLMFIFETLVIGFYISQNYDIGLSPLDGLPRSPPRDTARKSLVESGRNGSTRMEALQVARWRATIDWWSQTCSYCVGFNRQEWNHCLSQCTYGGAKLLKKGIGKALYERTHAPDSACDWCYLPKDLCDKWVKRRHKDWRRKEGFSICGYRRHILRDVIIGLLQSDDRRFKDATCEAARHWQELRRDPVLDNNAMTEFFLREITVAGVGGTEMMRQATELTHMVWYGASAGKAQIPESAWAGLVTEDMDANTDCKWPRGSVSPSSPRSRSPSVTSERYWFRTGIALRDSNPLERHERSAMVYRALDDNAGLEATLIERRFAKPIGEWQEEDIIDWAHLQRLRSQRWADWDDDGLSWERYYDEGRIRQQLLRWSVRCPLCLLHRDPGCHDHAMSSCHRIEGAEARAIRHRLWESVLAIRTTGLDGYGAVPWCSDCCLPRSNCPSWTKDGDDRASSRNEWDRDDDRLWTLQARGVCAYRDTIINAVAAIMSVSYSDMDSFGQQVQIWRERSRIRFSRCRGLEGWLASPMQWDRRDVMVMLRVFCRLDLAVEDLWIDRQVETRRAVLGLSSSGFCFARRRTHQPDAVNISGGHEGTPPWPKIIREALDAAKCESQGSSYYLGKSGFRWDIQSRLQSWHRRGIRCATCMAYEWSEACYLHEMDACTLHQESESAKALLRRWADLRGADGGGEEDQCESCRFPSAVCRLGHEDDSDRNPSSSEGTSCEGVRVMTQVVAALMTVANGSLGELVVEEAEKASKWKNAVSYETLSREWMSEQINTAGGVMPRIANIFQRLVDGFEGLRRAGWKGGF